MRIYVSVDIEGISGVVHADMMMPGQTEYGRGRMLMTKDANAAIEGLVQAGADDILVADGHGPMRNILIEELHEAASLMTGTGDAREACQLEGADGGPFDAAVFVGYHAMARTMSAIHPHTIAGAVVSEIRINGRPHGETGINAAVLGSMGIPTIMVTGDQALVKEARDFLGEGIETVQVKEARGHNAAICRPLQACYTEITEAAQRAVAQDRRDPALHRRRAVDAGGRLQHHGAVQPGVPHGEHRAGQRPRLRGAWRFAVGAVPGAVGSAALGPVRAGGVAEVSVGTSCQMHRDPEPRGDSVSRRVSRDPCSGMTAFRTGAKIPPTGEPKHEMLPKAASTP